MDITFSRIVVPPESYAKTFYQGVRLQLFVKLRPTCKKRVETKIHTFLVAEQCQFTEVCDWGEFKVFAVDFFVLSGFSCVQFER